MLQTGPTFLARLCGPRPQEPGPDVTAPRHRDGDGERVGSCGRGGQRWARVNPASCAASSELNQTSAIVRA
jgi:hypothetical protein